MPSYDITLDIKCWRTDHIVLDAPTEKQAAALAVKYWRDGPPSLGNVHFDIGHAEPDCEESPDVVEITPA